MATILVLCGESDCAPVCGPLHQAGHDVHWAPIGPEGAESLNREAPDLVILDPVVPHQGGLDAVEAAAKLHPEVPLLVILGHGEAWWPTRMAAEHCGACRVLTRPYSPDKLLDAVERSLAVRH